MYMTIYISPSPFCVVRYCVSVICHCLRRCFCEQRVPCSVCTVVWCRLLMFLKSVCYQLVLLTEFAFYASTGAVNIAVAFPIRTVLSRKCTSV